MQQQLRCSSGGSSSCVAATVMKQETAPETAMAPSHSGSGMRVCVVLALYGNAQREPARHQRQLWRRRQQLRGGLRGSK